MFLKNIIYVLQRASRQRRENINKIVIPIIIVSKFQGFLPRCVPSIVTTPKLHPHSVK